MAKVCDHIWLSSKDGKRSVCGLCNAVEDKGVRVVHVMNSEAIDETKRDALEKKRIADETRAYVLEHFTKLKGCTIPVEILRIQNLPSHNCLIIDDHLLLSYTEAKELLEQIV